MNFAVFIDYANLYINIKNIYGLSRRDLIEDKICECINKTVDYVKKSQPNRKINIIGSVAYILPDPVFGNPVNKLKVKADILGIVVKEDRKNKSEEMKKMLESRNDDRELAKGVINVIREDRVHGVIVISNDNDFIGTAQQVQSIGKYYWCGAMEAKWLNSKKRVYCGKKIKNISDKTIPIYDIMQGNDEGEVLEEIVSLEKEDLINGPRIEIFKDRKLIVSYPINKKNISLGRRSLRRNHMPNIDLTEYDKEKIISREHGNIRKVGDKLIFFVNKKCTRPTWYKTTPRLAGSQFTLEANKSVVLGDKNGFVMFYKID